MNLDELQQRIDRWEDLHTEFKAGPIRPDDLAATLVAFANTDGGQLVFGVSEERRIVGVEDADALTRQVDNVAAQYYEPPVTVFQEVLQPEATDQPVVVVNVPKGSMRPYRTQRGVYYIRTSSGRRRACSSAEIRSVSFRTRRSTPPASPEATRRSIRPTARTSRDGYWT